MELNTKKGYDDFKIQRTVISRVPLSAGVVVGFVVAGSLHKSIIQTGSGTKKHALLMTLAFYEHRRRDSQCVIPSDDGRAVLENWVLSQGAHITKVERWALLDDCKFISVQRNKMSKSDAFPQLTRLRTLSTMTFAAASSSTQI